MPERTGPLKPYKPKKRKVVSPLKEEQRENLRKLAAESPDGMVISRFMVENVMKVKFADITPTGDVVVVGGRNGQGKSSVLKAIGYLLCGRGPIPTDVIRIGQKTASIAAIIGPYKVTRYFTRVDPQKTRNKTDFWFSSVRVTWANGLSLPEDRKPQFLLYQLLDILSFDPMEFLRMEPKHQFERIKQLSTFSEDVEALDTAYEADYKARHDKKVEWNALKARLTGLPEAPAGSETVTQADVEELTRQLQSAAEWNAQVKEQRRKKASFEASAEQLRQAAKRMREDGWKMMAEAALIDGQMYPVPNPRYSADNQVEKQMEMAAAIEPGTEIDTVALGAQLQAAQAALAANAKAAQRAEVAAECATAEAEWTAIDTRMEENRAQKLKAFQSATLPVPGLRLSDAEELWYGEVPFGQASGSEQIRVSLAIAMAAHPKVRCLRFLDGGWDMLDEESQQFVRDEVKKNGYQLWVESVGSGKGVTVLMTEGEAAGEDVTA